MIAAKWNRLDVIEGLLKEHQKGKDIGLQKKDSFGKTAAHIAFDHHHYQAAKLLDDQSHTLSAASRDKVNQNVMVVDIPDTNTIHQELFEVFNAGQEVARKIDELGQISLQKRNSGAKHRDDGELTDTDDLTFLNKTTDEFCNSSSAACGSSLWKKPAHAKAGVRELCRKTLSGDSARFIHRLCANRGSDNVIVSPDKITVHLRTTK